MGNLGNSKLTSCNLVKGVGSAVLSVVYRSIDRQSYRIQIKVYAVRKLNKNPVTVLKNIA